MNPMKIRALFLAVLLAATLTAGLVLGQRGQLREIEQGFLDFLVAYGRDTFTQNLPARSEDVVLVEMHEEDKAEYSAWPPAPLDYILALKRLAPQEPEMVAFTMPLHWTGEQAQFIPELKDQLVPIPTVVLGFSLLKGPTPGDQEAADFFRDSLPILSEETTEGRGSAPYFLSVLDLPVKALRFGSQLGFVSAESLPYDPKHVPLVASDGRRLTPSLAVQALTAYRRVPYAAQRLRFGNGARLSLEDRYIVPLEKDGTLLLKPLPEVPRINALSLMTPDLGDEADKNVRETLGKHKAIVFTLTTQKEGEAQAQALAQGLALPAIHQSRTSVWVLCGIAILLSFWQLRFGRFGALAFGTAMVIGGLLSSLLAFSNSLHWWSPVLPIALQGISTIFCFLFPRRAVSFPEDALHSGPIGA